MDEYGNLHADHVPFKYIPATTKCKQIMLSDERKKEFATNLILEKVKGEQEVLDWVFEHQLIESPEHLFTDFEGTTIDELRIFEAMQAKTYWGTLADIPMKFNKPKKVPSSEWNSVGSRTSVKTKSPRKAITPFHAILNYCYTLTSTRIKRSLLDYRVDPALPIMHAVNSYRDNLVYDLIESIRPVIDKQLISFLSKDFALTVRLEWFMYSDGICLLDPDYANVWHKRILTKDLDKRIDTIVQAYVQALKDHH